MNDNRLPIDSKGCFYSKPSFWLNPQEYAKIRSEINQIYETQYKNKRIAAHTPFGIDGNASRLDVVSGYMDANPGALSSDILEFISGQKDFYDDVYANTEVS